MNVHDCYLTVRLLRWRSGQVVFWARHNKILLTMQKFDYLFFFLNYYIYFIFFCLFYSSRKHSKLFNNKLKLKPDSSSIIIKKCRGSIKKLRDNKRYTGNSRRLSIEHSRKQQRHRLDIIRQSWKLKFDTINNNYNSSISSTTNNNKINITNRCCPYKKKKSKIIFKKISTRTDNSYSTADSTQRKDATW